jgi:hypothetical protein
VYERRRRSRKGEDLIATIPEDRLVWTRVGLTALALALLGGGAQLPTRSRSSPAQVPAHQAAWKTDGDFPNRPKSKRESQTSCV